MDVIYEESAVNKNRKKGERNYKIFNTISYIFGIFGLIITIIFLYNLFICIVGRNVDDKDALSMQISLTTLFGLVAIFLDSIWVWSFLIKRRLNINYDYTFVSGELRISKVFNVNRRKFITKIDAENILAIGDVENGNFERLRYDPNNKYVVLTPNNEPAEGKFFMYIHAVEFNTRKLYVLEVREEMLIQILNFAKRGVLEKDYVAQAKKQK